MKITIITSTYNACADLRITAASIRNQTYPDIQWIIADGGSTDGTLDAIRENSDIIDVWFSAPDEGIYDAWNKAIPQVRGEWVQFLGAGDELAAPDTLERVARVLETAHPAHDLVYGKLLFLSEHGRVPVEEVGEPWDKMKGRWKGFLPKLPIHPEVFHHVSILDGNKTFDRRFRIAGDSHLLLKHIMKKDPLFVPILVDRMPLGGASGKIASAWKVACETSRIDKDLGIEPPLMHSIAEWGKVYCKVGLNRGLPPSLLHRFADTWRILMGKKPRWTIP